MEYEYSNERNKIFTDEGQRDFIKILERTRWLLKTAGACRASEMMSALTGDSWFMLVCIDRMVELGIIKEVTGPDAWGQHRVFVGNTQ